MILAHYSCHLQIQHVKLFPRMRPFFLTDSAQLWLFAADKIYQIFLKVKREES